MINAGVNILPFNGSQIFNETTKQWDDVEVLINYPTGQNITNNPPNPEDFVVEPTGKVWVVKAATILDAGQSKVSLTLEGLKEQSQSQSPSFGTVGRGGIMTPTNGVLAPHWDASKVSTDVGRIVSGLNAELGNYGGDGGSTTDASQLTEGTLSETVIPSLPTSKISGLDTTIANKADKSQVDTVTSSVSSIETLLSSNDTTLDEIQEIVDFIKMNKSTLDNLGISNIAGLQSALDSKVDGNHTHEMSEITNLVDTLLDKAETNHTHSISDVSNLQPTLEAKQDNLVSGTSIKTVNGESVLGSGDIVVEGGSGGGADIVNVTIDNFTSFVYTVSSGVTVSKEYSDSSLKIVHNKGKTPVSWSGVNFSSSPATAIIPNATLNMQVVDSNTIVLTNVNNFESAEYNLIF